jgi:hypothetical protein
MCIEENIVMFRLISAVLILTRMGLSASTDPIKDDKADLMITLERTACFGSCPVYKLTVRGDGSLTYEGHKFVRVEGSRQGTLDKEAVAQIAQAFIDADYFELKDRYSAIENPDGTETVVTDLPSTYTSISLNRRRKAVADYVGAPKKLIELEEKIDRITNSKRWVAIDSSAVHEEAKHGWNVRSLPAQKLLREAAERGDAAVVQAFIEEGADVNAGAGLLTPLQRARNAEVVKLFISAGADVNATSKEYFGPPLSFAAELGDAESIKALVNAGAKVDGRSPNGDTALMQAARSGHPAAVRALLNAGADVHAQNAQGEDAWNFAQIGLAHQSDLAKNPNPFEEAAANFATNYKEITEMLKAAGALKTDR